MFNVKQPTEQTDDQGGSLLQRLTDAEDAQRIYLPRGSAQSRCEPPSYYYLASDSGAVPSWVVDEARRKRLRGGAD